MIRRRSLSDVAMSNDKLERRWDRILKEEAFIPLAEFARLSARFQREARRRGLTKRELLRAIKIGRRNGPNPKPNRLGAYGFPTKRGVMVSTCRSPRCPRRIQRFHNALGFGPMTETFKYLSRN